MLISDDINDMKHLLILQKIEIKIYVIKGVKNYVGYY